MLISSHLKIAIYKLKVIYDECVYTVRFSTWKFIGPGPVIPL